MDSRDLYEPIRLILGDRKVHGIWAYEDATLKSSLKAVFLLGRAPPGYIYDDVAETIAPDFATGDPCALVCYDACKLLITGEDGAIRIQTRALTVADSGHRKRDLLAELEQVIYEIRDGGAVFATWQSLAGFLQLLSRSPGQPLGDVLSALPGLSEVNVRSLPDLSI